MQKEKSISREIIRFIITGIIATLVDFGVSSLIAALIPDSFGAWKEVIYTSCGFIVSLVINYLLSAFWVYKNVDKSVNKLSPKNLLLFTAFSVVGLLIGIGMMFGFDKIDQYCLHVDFENWFSFIFNKEQSFSFLALLWFCIFFGLKTLVVLFWNYISRKKFIFKSPEDVAKTNQEK